MLTEYGDGMLTCVECSEGRVAGGKPTVDFLGPLGFRVRCAECGTMGPRRQIEAAAKEAWNRIQRGLALQDAVERTEEVERLKLAAFHALRDSKTPEGTPICGQCGATGHVKDECDRLWAGL